MSLFTDQDKSKGVLFVHSERTDLETEFDGIVFVCWPSNISKVRRCAEAGISSDLESVDNNRLKLLMPPKISGGDQETTMMPATLKGQPLAIITHVECMKVLMTMQKWGNRELVHREGSGSAITDVLFCDWLVIYCGDIGSAVLDHIYALWIHMVKQNIRVPRIVVVSSRQAPATSPLPLSRCSHVCVVSEALSEPAEVTQINLSNIDSSPAKILDEMKEKLPAKYTGTNTIIIVPNQELAEEVTKKFPGFSIVSEGKHAPDGDSLLIVIGNAFVGTMDPKVCRVFDYGIESAPGGIFVRCSPEIMHYRAKIAQQSRAKYYLFSYKQVMYTQGCEFLSSSYNPNFHLSLMLNSYIDPRRVFSFSDATMRQKVEETLVQMSRDGSIGLERDSVTIMPLGIRAYSMGIDLEEAKLFERWTANNEPLPIAIFIAITHKKDRVDFLERFKQIAHRDTRRHVRFYGDSYIAEMMMTVAACFVETFDIEEMDEDALAEIECDAYVCDSDAFRKILKHVQRILSVYHRESRKPIQVGTFDIMDFFDELANYFEVYTHAHKGDDPRDFYEGTKTYVLAKDIYDPPKYLVVLELAPVRRSAITNANAGTIISYFPVYNKFVDN